MAWVASRLDGIPMSQSKCKTKSVYLTPWNFKATEEFGDEFGAMLKALLGGYLGSWLAVRWFQVFRYEWADLLCCTFMTMLRSLICELKLFTQSCVFLSTRFLLGGGKIEALTIPKWIWVWRVPTQELKQSTRRDSIGKGDHRKRYLTVLSLKFYRRLLARYIINGGEVKATA